MNTTVVLFSCMNGRPKGDQRPWIAMGISKAICNKKITELEPKVKSIGGDFALKDERYVQGVAKCYLLVSHIVVSCKLREKMEVSQACG